MYSIPCIEQFSDFLQFSSCSIFWVLQTHFHGFSSDNSQISCLGFSIPSSVQLLLNFDFQLSFSFSTLIFIFNFHFHCPLVQFLFSSSGCIFCFCSNLNFILWQLHVSILRKDHQCSHLYCWIFEILLAPVLNLGSSDDLGRYLSIWAIWAQAEMFKFSVTRRRICLVPNPLRKVATGLPQYCSDLTHQMVGLLSAQMQLWNSGIYLTQVLSDTSHNDLCWAQFVGTLHFLEFLRIRINFLNISSNFKLSNWISVHSPRWFIHRLWWINMNYMNMTCKLDISFF